MAFSYIAKSQWDSPSTSSASPTKPTGTVDGDILFAFISRSTSGEPTTIPTGFVKVCSISISASLAYVGVYWKIAASEGSSFNWQWLSADKTRVEMATFRDSVVRKIGAFSNTAYNTADTIARAASFTIPEASPVVFFGVGHATSVLSFTPPTGFTEHVDAGSTGSDKTHTICSDELSAGSSGDIDATISATITNKHAIAISLSEDVSSSSMGMGGGF